MSKVSTTLAMIDVTMGNIPNVIQKSGFRLRQSPGVRSIASRFIFLILTDLRSFEPRELSRGPNPIFESRSV